MPLLNIGRWQGHFRVPPGLCFKTRVKLEIIIHLTHYLFSDWLISYSEFSKSAPGTSSSCRLYNNHVKDTQGRQGLSCHVRPRCMISKGNNVKLARFVFLDVTKVAKQSFADYVKEKKMREPWLFLHV